jgi:hypothetical protein
MTKALKSHDLVVVVDAIQPCWLSDCAGDPGRTCAPESAQRFTSRTAAEKALAAARATYPGRIYSIDTLPSL